MPAVTKPVLPLLQTPKSASFPSEIITSPLPGLAAAVIKQEDALKTPITPPSAYTNFLKAITPVLASPAPLSAIPKSLSSDGSSAGTTPTSEPSTSSSFSFNQAERVKSLSVAVPPPSPFGHGQTARTPTSLRRLRIPQSPNNSPGTASPLSANVARSPFSPSEWGLDGSGHRYFEAPRSACVRPVSVRSVVTRTVTYKRTPLDPAPKGKKRRMNSPEMPPPPTAMAAPAAVV